ncbi:MAG: LON peptidase substrate-binding domain-containing protein, partial [Deltaproteobacteria bacterium]|nr:LON peptidase substrate-binding domain-containing protein [Deltaproteobacteria bacterium]
MFFRERRPSNPNRERRLPLLPLRELVVFPHAAVSFIVGRERSIAALNEAMKGEKEIFLATQREAGTREPTPSEVHEVGTVASVVQVMRLPDATVKVLVDGLRRARILRFVGDQEHFMVEVEELPEPAPAGPETVALMRQVKEAFDEFVRLNKSA